MSEPPNLVVTLDTGPRRPFWFMSLGFFKVLRLMKKEKKKDSASPSFAGGLGTPG